LTRSAAPETTKTRPAEAERAVESEMTKVEQDLYAITAAIRAYTGPARDDPEWLNLLRAHKAVAAEYEAERAERDRSRVRYCRLCNQPLPTSPAQP
jgi:hypothetical protein